jgi:hypothetical protein
MGIRSQIKSVLGEHLDPAVALSKITALVNQPKQQKLPFPEPIDVFRITITSQPEVEAWRARIDYNPDQITPDAVRAALEAICEFAEERHLVESAQLFTTN